MTSTALVHNGAPPGAALAIAPARQSGLIRPVAPPSEVLAVQEETRKMVAEILQPGRDFGVIPGTDKPTMLKPGAERTVLAFGCYYGDPEILEKEIDHDRPVHWIKRKKVWTNAFKGDRSFTWQEEHGESLGLYRYVLRVPIISRDSGAVVGYGIGSCSTMESKYIDRPRDAENTALKMAHKRAIVSGCLITFGLSDQFTQDVEDLPHAAEAAPAGHPALDPACPKCGGKMWDNRLSKKNPKAPDFKCKTCDGAIFPPKAGEEPTAGSGSAARQDPEEVAADELEELDNDIVLTLTLESALAMPLPGSKTAWNGKGGTPLGQLSPKMLEAVLRWTQGKIDEAGAEGQDADPVKARLITAIKLILPHMKAEADKAVGQETMALDTPAAPAAAVDTSLAPGKIEDALDFPTGGAAPRPATAAVNPAPAPPTTAGSGGGSAARSTSPQTAGSTTTADAPSLTKLSRDITNLLKDTKLTDDERKDYRARLDACTTLEQLQALNTDLKAYLDQPF